ncbi:MULTISPECIES: 3-methyladenine DNA glycosylase [unclassified Luteococcus]|uniref:3-methyladenine DNA glycosylase n=1 Tax=unclassified Luteococcus TaxID=2639923 RepID=UPI00313F273E
MAEQITVLAPRQWQARRDAHRARAEALLAGVAQRRRHGRKHPVEDFLFDYYNLRPGELMVWHPGAGVALGDPDGEYAGRKFYRHDDGISQLDQTAFLAKRAGTVEWTRTLLGRTATNPAHFGCFGMHEWAMVYHLTPDQTRHHYLPLRFEPERIAEVVEQVGLRCSHFDAFRFFTPDAEPLNALRPTREEQPELDQPGCLHVGMDLYKWAGKLLPACDSELLLDTFELARDIRELDMRASAYDLSGWGYAPVPVETPAGRADYVRRQKAFAERASPLRGRLLRLLDWLP